MTLATSEPPLRPSTRMTEEEAIEITDAIKGNIDSLGKMLIEMQERKGYLALGYKSLEQYAVSEFGKSKSRIYQAIQEFKIEEEIVETLAAENSQVRVLKMPGTHLRMLKDLPSEKKVEAIKYANLLAEQEGRKRATKLHLQVATLKFGGQKPEHLRKSIKDMGFAKGVEVELTQGFGKGGRGVIRRFDKKGQIYVEMHKGNSVPQPWDVEHLRIVPDNEKPQIPASTHTAKIGDKVKIYSNHRLRGKTGEIAARINEKIAAVKAEGEPGVTEIPYAEMEVCAEAKVIDSQVSTWDKDKIWGSKDAKGQWFYSSKEGIIKSFGLPEVYFNPNKKDFTGPAEWLEWWQQNCGCELATDLLTPDQVATLVMTVAIGMTPEEKRDFLLRINALLSVGDRQLLNEPNLTFQPQTKIPPNPAGKEAAEIITKTESSANNSASPSEIPALLANSNLIFPNLSFPDHWTDWERIKSGWLLNNPTHCFYEGKMRKIEAFLPESKTIRLEGMQQGKDYLDMWAVEPPQLNEEGCQSHPDLDAKFGQCNPDKPEQEIEKVAELPTVYAASTASALELEGPPEFVAGNPFSSETPESWRAFLESVGFYAMENEDVDWDSTLKICEYRDWEVFTERDVITNLRHPGKGLFSQYQEQGFDWEYIKDIINKVEDCPGQLKLFEISEFATQASNPIEIEAIEQEGDNNWQQEWLKKLPVRPEITYSTTQGQLREKITEKLDTLADKADALSKSLQSQRLTKAARSAKEKKLKATQKAIKDLEIFSTLQIGMLVGHTSGHINIGIVTNLTLSTGGMPEAWVKWDKASVEVPEKISFINIKKEEL